MVSRRVTSYSILLRPLSRPQNSQPRFQCRKIHSPNKPIAAAASILQYTYHDQTLSTYCQRQFTSRTFRSPSRRHASTAAATVSSKPTPPSPIIKPTTTVPFKPTYRPTALRTPLAALNPPSETYAPPLDLPTRNPNVNIFTHLFRTGRAYLSFYKTGIKRVRSNYKLSKTYSFEMLSVVQSPASASTSSPPSFRELLSGAKIMRLGITRGEWQLIRRNKKDVYRVPGFLLLFVIFGEWLPLIALWITPVVPDPCRIPKQVERVERKREARRRERLRRIAMDAARYRSLGQERKGNAVVKGVGLDNMDKAMLLQLSARLDVHSRGWDWLFLTPPVGLLRWGVKRRTTYLDADDALIRRDGGVNGLNGEEVRRACIDRGFDTLGRPEDELRKDLKGWFKKA